MANARDHAKMKLVSCFVTKKFKQRVTVEARKKGVSVSGLIRDLLKQELNEDGEIGSQRK